MTTFVFTMVFLLFSANLEAQMSSTNYRIDWDNIGFGGSDTGSSASYKLRDTIGVGGQSSYTSSSYTVTPGFRSGIYDQVVSFNLYVENRATQVGVTSITSTSVNVSAVGAFSVDDYIAVIQNEGISQVAAIGKITGIGGSTLTIDFWTDAGVTPVIDSNNDYVYALTGTSHSFGTLTSSAVTTGIIAWEVNADVGDGYGVYVYEDTNLKTGASSSIADVSDGAVSIAAAEYGGRANDSTLASSTFDTVDTAFTTTASLIGSRTDNSFKSRDFITLKASVTSTLPTGTYSHNLFFTYVGDY